MHPEDLEEMENKINSSLRTRMIIAVFVSIWLFLAVWTPSAAEKIELNASLDLCTDYVWRGLVINDEPVFQPSWAVTQSISHVGSFSFNLWGNLDFTDYTGTTNKFSEIDLIASYSLPSGPLGLEVGIIHYAFPSTSDHATTEVYILGDYELEGVPLAFSLGVFYDFDEINGFYLSAKIESLLSLLSSLKLELAFSAGYGDSRYNRGYFNVSNSSLLDGLVSSALVYKVSNSFSLLVRGQYMFLLNSTIKDSVPKRSRDKLTGCLSLQFDF